MEWCAQLRPRGAWRRVASAASLRPLVRVFTQSLAQLRANPRCWFTSSGTFLHGCAAQLRTLCTLCTVQGIASPCTPPTPWPGSRPRPGGSCSNSAGVVWRWCNVVSPFLLPRAKTASGDTSTEILMSKFRCTVRRRNLTLRWKKILLFKGGSLEKYFYGLVGAKIKNS